MTIVAREEPWRAWSLEKRLSTPLSESKSPPQAGPREDRALAVPSPSEYPKDCPTCVKRAGLDNCSFV